jgi:hypothetical protein
MNNNNTTDSLPLIRPEWVDAITHLSIHFKWTDTYGLALYYADEHPWWSVAYLKEDCRFEHIVWDGGTLDDAYRIVYCALRPNGVTVEALEAIIRDARTLAKTPALA